MGPPSTPPGDAFAAFLAEVEPRLRRALVAAYGPDAGREAAVDALAWAWEHWDRVAPMANPVGYLYRVGQTEARRARRREGIGTLDAPPPGGAPWVEPGLRPALAGLSDAQRVAVVLCHGFAWTHREVADLLDVAPTTVQNHVERGLAKLRRSLEVQLDG